MAKVRPSDIGEIFKYIQKGGCRRPRTCKRQCAKPREEEGGEYRTSQSKCGLLGRFVESRWNDETFLPLAQHWGRAKWGEKDKGALSPETKFPAGPNSPADAIEVRKPVRGLAPHKAPEADRFQTAADPASSAG